MLTKAQMMEELPKFFADKNRGISLPHFAELCGVDHYHLRDIFIYKKVPLTERVQRRVNKIYAQVLNGEIRTMQRGLKRWVEYRETPKPAMVRRTLLTFDGQGFKLDVGIRPRAEDYRRRSLDEQMKG
jgi:hypothetical protein